MENNDIKMNRGMVYLNKVAGLGVPFSGITDQEYNANNIAISSEASIRFYSNGQGVVNQGGSQTNFDWNSDNPDLTGNSYSYQITMDSLSISSQGDGTEDAEVTHDGGNTWSPAPTQGNSTSGTFSGDATTGLGSGFGFRCRATNGSAGAGNNGSIDVTITIDITTTSPGSGTVSDVLTVSATAWSDSPP